MPPPRKIDLLPEELRRWLQTELKERGFAGYEDLAESLNFRLEEEGLELRIGKTSLHAYGSEFKEYAELEAKCSDEIKAFLGELSLSDEVDVTTALHQQLTSIQWRLQMSMSQSKNMPDAKAVKDLTSALNNLVRSTTLRDSIIKADRKAQSTKLTEAVEAGDIDLEAAQAARAIMGFE